MTVRSYPIVPEYRFLLNTKVPDLSRYPLNNNTFVINLEIVLVLPGRPSAVTKAYAGRTWLALEFATAVGASERI